MKFSSALLLVSATMAAADKTINGATASKILRSARRVEEAVANDAYLGNYNMKMIHCSAGEAVTNEKGEASYGAVVLRLCPTESGCSSSLTQGCDSAYGDLVVPLRTFVEAYFEDQRDNMAADDQFDLNKYSKCEKYKVDNKNNNNGEENQWANYVFYLGATCTDSGDDIKLAVFEDNACTTTTEVTFEEISNGWTLPYSTGGLVSNNCADCIDVDEYGAASLREMCTKMYESATTKCETDMPYVSYYGANEEGCEYISELLPTFKKAKSGSAGKVFGWIIFILLIGGVAGYIMWWRKKKSGAKTTASDGLVA